MIKTTLTKNEIAIETVNLIMEHYTGSSMECVIGLGSDGQVAKFYPCHSESPEVEFYDTREWTLGDYDGDPSDDGFWTDDLFESLVALFENDWIEFTDIETARGVVRA